MNIKEHIEAGHYPKDEKGRALVPMRNSRVATILATDLSFGHFGIVGHVCDGPSSVWWRNSGHQYSDEAPRPLDLLPPSPRKVKVTGWAIMTPHGTVHSIRTEKPDRLAVSRSPIVELTGEYEEPWA